MAKVREVLSDDKRDWEHRVVAVRLFPPSHRQRDTPVSEPNASSAQWGNSAD